MINNQNTYLNIEDAHLRLRTGNVYAQGITIGGITVDPSHGLQRVSDTGNVTATTLQFDNATTAFTTTANVTVGRDLTVTGNALVSSNLTVTGNAVISDDLTVTGNAVTENLLVSNNLTVTGNTFYTNPAAVLVDSNVVTEYTGPHDRPLRKYPEVLTVDVTPTSPINATSPFMGKSQSWGGYTTIYSSRYNSNGDFNGIRVYDGALNTVNPWISGPATYSTSDGSATSSDTFQSTDGSYITLSLPNKIRLSHICIYNRDSAVTRPPKDGIIWGSSDGGTTFTQIHTFSNLDPTQGRKHTLHITSTTKYDTVVVQITAMTTISNTDAVAIHEIELYGYEEGSGSLDTTLKSVYNVPATTGTQLEVYYDGQDYTQASDFAGTGGVVDKVGGDQDGTAGTSVSFDSTYKAFVFDGTANGNITSSVLPSDFIGDIQHTVSLWFKIDSSSTVTNPCLFDVHKPGAAVGHQRIDIRLQTGSSYQFHYDFWNNYTRWKSPFGSDLPKDEWIHVTATYSGGLGSGPRNVYMNGRLCELVSQATVVNTTPLAVQAGSILLLGKRPDDTSLFDGSIANFRLYSKALNAGQVQELYDYQKDYFLGSKSQVTLYKGHLGVGVTEPSGQLELAGDERLQEYPPRGLIGDAGLPDSAGPGAYDYNVEGHGVFKLLSTYDYRASTSDDRRIYKLFDKSDSTTTHWSFFNSNPPYEATTNAQITTLDGGSAITAHIAEIQMPYKITLKKYILRTANILDRVVKTGMIVGSNDGNVFHVLHNVPDFGFTSTYQTKEYTVDNTTTPYRIFRLLLMNTVGSTACNMTEWRLFGTPGPTTLDKGSLSLGRSLDVPRVSRYDVDTETPRPEKLVVDFDTTVNSSPTDISGEGNHGTFYGATYSPADKAFNFDGTDDYIEAATNLGSGNQTLCFSMWLKPETDSRWFIDLGKNTATGGSFFAIRYDTYYQFNVKNGNHLQITAGSLNTWEHLVIIYHGTGSTKTAGTIEGYVNGVPGNIIDSDFADDQLSLSANPPIEIGARTGASNTYFDGQISNFKLYNVALEASEVQKLYRLGRTGRSMVISDTAVGIGKVPEAQLDVRGILKASVGLFQDKPFFACEAYRYGLKDNDTTQTLYWHAGDTATLSSAGTMSGCRWKLGSVTGNHTYKTNNVQLVRVLNDSSSETSGVRVPYDGYYHLTHQNRTISTNVGASFVIYSPRHNKYIQTSINGYRVPWGGNQPGGSGTNSNSVHTSLYLEAGDVVIYIFHNRDIADSFLSGSYEQFVSLVML